MNRKQMKAKLEEAGITVCTTKVDGFNTLTAHKDGRFTVRESFFYTGEKTEFDWRDEVVNALAKLGVKVELVTCYQRRQSWPKDSYWAVSFEMVNGKNVKLTTEQADEIIQASDYADLVEDHEFNEDTNEHIYTLDDGSTVTVTMDEDEIITLKQVSELEA